MKLVIIQTFCSQPRLHPAVSWSIYLTVSGLRLLSGLAMVVPVAEREDIPYPAIESGSCTQPSY